MTINKIYPENLTIKEQYALTMSPKIQRMSDIGGTVINVKAFASYTDEDKDGNEREILALMDQDGDVYATNSASFIREWNNITDLCDQCGIDYNTVSVEVVPGTSKAGRTFYTCAMV